MAEKEAAVRPRCSSEAAAIATVPSTVPSGYHSATGESTSVFSDLVQARKYSTDSERLSDRLKKGTSFLEDGARDVLAPTEFGFPVPKRGQTLCDFLSSEDFTTHMSPLDKENNHFYIAEIIIQAFEHSKYIQDEKRMSNNPTSESEFEAGPRNPPRQRKKRKERKAASGAVTLSTDYDASLCSDRDETKSQSSLDSEGSQAPLTAEGVALCLLRNFQDKPLPNASELTWIVSQSECNQELIPLPDSWPISPDETSQFRTRGNEHWAPPRKQIIFNKIFKEKSVKEALKLQNNQCAGCGMRMLPNSRLRMCHYLGKYFCQLCHHNTKSLIPARIILKWDFTQCPVSNFALELLKSFYWDPVFDLYDYSRSVFTKSRTLAKVTDIRGALRSAAQYVRTCKNANKDRILKVAEHLYTDQFKYSLNDFVQARSGELLRSLLDTYQRCVNHVQTCQLCHDQGYFCELCKTNEVIYPFDTARIIQCGSCRACYHKRCVKGGFICSKCERLRKRIHDTIQEAEEATEA